MTRGTLRIYLGAAPGVGKTYEMLRAARRRKAEGGDVGRHVELRKVIVDKDVTIPEGTKIGIDPEHDRARGFVVTESGLTVVGKGQSVVP